jgi:lipopolysaccharide export system permease protein
VSLPLFRPLDRYVLGSFFRIFFVTALGFPLLVVVIDATDHLGKYLDQNIPPKQIALSYLYFMPESLFMALPAAVLFATVFTVGSMTRHSEITAAKASGISFYRLIAPLVFGATFALAAGLVVGELVPIGEQRRNAILNEKRETKQGEVVRARREESRGRYAYSAENGRVYTFGNLAFSPRNATRSMDSGYIHRLEIVRLGANAKYPSVVTVANEASWEAPSKGLPGNWWFIRSGTVHIASPDSTVMSLNFIGMRDMHMKEGPRDLMQKATKPDEMRSEELGRFIAAMERSGSNVNPLRVAKMLRIAIPATCLIILLFGAPLATSNQRGGAAFGMGIALGTTMLFLMLVQLTKAVGNNGLLTPELAAWIPSAVFGLAGLVLLARVRT